MITTAPTTNTTNATTEQLANCSMAITTMAGSFALQNALLGVRIFDGKSMPLKDFIQDLRNGFLHVGQTQEAQFVRAVLSRLTGSARDSTYGKDFPTVESLIKHLKARFAPGKTYSYYSNQVAQMRMKQGETVGDFYDRINILMGCAQNSIIEELTLENEPLPGVRPEDLIKQLIRPLQLVALDVFIKGLPGDMALIVDATKPTTLEEAYEEAIRVEARINARILPDNRRVVRQTNYPYANYPSTQPEQYNIRSEYIGFINNYEDLDMLAPNNCYDDYYIGMMNDRSRMQYGRPPPELYMETTPRNNPYTIRRNSQRDLKMVIDEYATRTTHDSHVEMVPNAQNEGYLSKLGNYEWRENRPSYPQGLQDYYPPQKDNYVPNRGQNFRLNPEWNTKVGNLQNNIRQRQYQPYGYQQSNQQPYFQANEQYNPNPRINEGPRMNQTQIKEIPLRPNPIYQQPQQPLNYQGARQQQMTTSPPYQQQITTKAPYQQKMTQERTQTQPIRPVMMMQSNTASELVSELEKNMPVMMNQP